MTLAYRQRGSGPLPGNQAAGWCTWSFGGKNNSAWWYTQSGGVFDIEAADRPLNAYVLPDLPFYAPACPARLPANHPSRVMAQAEMFRDPGDNGSLQRDWPVPSEKITGYNDVGTSYLTNMAWWTQLGSIGNFQNRFDEGARRIAQERGANPSRFVWLTDHYGDALAQHPDPSFRIRNGHGDDNFAPLLFLDGHVAYEYIKPTVRTTTTYTLWFE